MQVSSTSLINETASVLLSVSLQLVLDPPALIQRGQWTVKFDANKCKRVELKKGKFSRQQMRRSWKWKDRGNLKIKLKFSHLFQSIFYHTLVFRVDDSRLNFTVLIKVNRIWNEEKIKQRNFWENARSTSIVNCNLKRITPHQTLQHITKHNSKIKRN